MYAFDVDETEGYGTSGDSFKPSSELLLSDIRYRYWQMRDANGAFRPITLLDLHNRVSEFSLNSSVPEEIQTNFDTARHLYVYSWFAYRFIMVAQLHAYSTLEFAIGKKIEIEKLPPIKNLYNRFEFAASKGWWNPKEIRCFKRSTEARKAQMDFYDSMQQIGAIVHIPSMKTEEDLAREYLDRLKKAIPSLRNSLAHGSKQLHNGAEFTLELCCDLINQLFPPTESS